MFQFPKVTYKPDCEFDIVEMFDGYCLRVSRKTADADGRLAGDQLKLNFEIEVTPKELLANKNLFNTIIYQFFKQYEEHEMMEWLRIDDVRVKEPHAFENRPVIEITTKG